MACRRAKPVRKGIDGKHSRWFVSKLWYHNGGCILRWGLLVCVCVSEPGTCHANEAMASCATQQLERLHLLELTWIIENWNWSLKLKSLALDWIWTHYLRIFVDPFVVFFSVCFSLKLQTWCLWCSLFFSLAQFDAVQLSKWSFLEQLLCFKVFKVDKQKNYKRNLTTPRSDAFSIMAGVHVFQRPLPLTFWPKSATSAFLTPWDFLYFSRMRLSGGEWWSRGTTAYKLKKEDDKTQLQ